MHWGSLTSCRKARQARPYSSRAERERLHFSDRSMSGEEREQLGRGEEPMRGELDSPGACAFVSGEKTIFFLSKRNEKDDCQKRCAVAPQPSVAQSD